MKAIFFILAAIFFALAGYNLQFSSAANTRTSIRWEFFGAAALVIALWIV